MRREGDPRALVFVHMADYDLDVVPRLAWVVEVAIHWIEDQFPTVASSRVGRIHRVHVRVRKDQAAGDVGRARRAGRAEDPVPRPDAVEGVEDGVVVGASRADGMIGTVVDGEPLAVGARKRRIVGTAGTSGILLPVIPTVVAHRAVELF